MIITPMGSVIIGVAAGAAMDELLRGRDRRSTRVIIAGLAGAIGGLLIRRASGGDDALIDAFAALFGAGVLAFVLRARISAAIGRVAAP